MFVGNIELEHIRRYEGPAAYAAERGEEAALPESKPPYGYDKVLGRPRDNPVRVEAPWYG